MTAIDTVMLRALGSMKDGECYAVGSGHNLGVLLGYSDGVVELSDIYGEVLYRYDSGHNAGVQYLVCTTQGDGTS